MSLHRFHIGVEYCLFVYGLTRASVQINSGSTLSLFVSLRLETNTFLKMEAKRYYYLDVAKVITTSGCMYMDFICHCSF